MGKQFVSKEEADILREELKTARRALEESEKRLKKTYDDIEMEKQIDKERKHKEILDKRNR